MSIPKISGRQARELLDGSTPGPWTATEDHIIRLGREKRGRQSPWDDDDPDPWMADESDHVLMNPEPEWKPLTENRADMLLAAAAPVLAETVAWLYGSEPNEPYDEWRIEAEVGLRGHVHIADNQDGTVELVTGPYGVATYLKPDEAVEVARALLAAAEEARP